MTHVKHLRCLSLSLSLSFHVYDSVWACVPMFVCVCVCVCVCDAVRIYIFAVLPYEFIGSEFAHGCSDRNWGKAPCPMKSYSSRNVFPWIDYACNTQIHGFNNAYSNLCVEMTAAFGQYYLSSTV